MIKLTEFLLLLVVKMLDLVHFYFEFVIEDLLGCFLCGTLSVSLYLVLGVGDPSEVDEGSLLGATEEASMVRDPMDFTTACKYS